MFFLLYVTVFVVPAGHRNASYALIYIFLMRNNIKHFKLLKQIFMCINLCVYIWEWVQYAWMYV